MICQLSAPAKICNYGNSTSSGLKSLTTGAGDDILHEICLYFGSSWLELVTLSFSRAQLGTHLECFEGNLCWFWKLLNARKFLSDAGLQVVPGGGIEPSTHGFSVRPRQNPICCKCLIYQLVTSPHTLGGVGWNWVELGPRGQSDGQSEKVSQSNILWPLAGCFRA